MRRAFCVVTLFALACLLPRAARVGLAGAYVDPVARITAQDEALYSHSALVMALPHGDWLTPHFLGRPALYKPPFLVWTAALSAKLLGATHLTLRLPVAIFAAFAVALIFLWGAEATSLHAGACAALLVLGNHLFLTLSTLCMTDALLLAFTVGAVYCLYSDPWLESRAAFWGFAVCSAAAILTKSIAGVIPLAILGLYWLAARPKERPPFLRVTAAGAIVIALAAPWFLFQLAVHPHWFLAEHIAVEVLGYGAGAPPQTSRENPLLFYILRMAATDPVLFAAALVAVPAFVTAVRRRAPGPTLLACWLAVTVVATLAWQYRNASYLLALVPALALMGASYGPFAATRKSMLLMVCAGIVFKLAAPDLTWGLSYAAGTVQPLAPALSRYCEQYRMQGLIVVDLADDLYTTTLPLFPQPRYAIVGPQRAAGAYGMPFEEMGIIVTVQQYINLPALAPIFQERLHEWGVESTDPIASLITARSPRELDELVRARPAQDFLVPERYRAFITDTSHVETPAAPGFYFLLSKGASAVHAVPTRPWTCRM